LLRVFAGFKYHLKKDTLPGATEVVVSTKVIQYGVPDKQPISAAA
jgi:hypothetical protein